jgi:hypothetical protein
MPILPKLTIPAGKDLKDFMKEGMMNERKN